ncbi:MAG: hypothetical protein AAFO69_20165, partial [Bacteroidota bacterium]
NNQNFLIGHSMGGLIAREYVRQNNNRANAILTIGTPHNGAWIANNVRNGNAERAINDGVAEMTAGPFSEGKSLITNLLGLGGLPGIFASIWANKKIDEITEDFYAGVRESVANFIAGVNRQSLADLSVGSNYLNGLNGANIPVPVANIICEENDRSGFRLAQAAIQSPENAALHTYDDGDLIRAADKIRGVYKTFRIYHDVRKFTKPWRYGHHNRQANRWHRGENFLKDGFNNAHARLIGAVRTERRTTTRWVQECGPFADDCHPRRSERELIPIDDCLTANDPDECRWVQRTITTTVTITENSDGLVTVGSQRTNGTPNANVYRAVGVNHLEIGNHLQMTQRLNEVFNRNDVYRVPAR